MEERGRIEFPRYGENDSLIESEKNSETSTEVVFSHLHVRIKCKKRANNWKLFTDFLNEEMSEILSGKTHR